MRRLKRYSLKDVDGCCFPTPVSPSGHGRSRLTDSHGRVIHDLRVSITDRCNYKCVYCRTGEVGAQYAELPIDDYLRLIRLFVGLGITKVRLTGGEPLLRHGLVEMVKELARLRTIEASPSTWPSPPTAICSQTWPHPQSRRPSPRHRQHGRRRRPHLRAHHPRSRQLRKLFSPASAPPAPPASRRSKSIAS